MTNESLTLTQAIISILIMAAITFFLRYFPFAFFSKREPPPLFNYIGKFLPPMVMAVLIVYSVKSIDFTAAPYGIAAIAGSLFTVVMHLWKKNAMLSIFGGTIIYMILQ